MRNVLAVLLAALAAISGVSAWGGSVANEALTQPQTVQSALGPLITDPSVRSMISTKIQSEAVSRLPGGVVPEKLKTVFDAAVTSATNAVLDDPQTQQAWLESLEASRVKYVNDVRNNGQSAGTVVLVLDPLATLAASHVATAISSLGVTVAAPTSVEWQLQQSLSDVSPLANLLTPVMSLVVHQSAHWGWYWVAAAVLLVLALLVARRRAVPVFVGGVITLIAGGVGLWGAGLVRNMTGATSNAVLGSVAADIGSIITDISWPVIWVGLGVLVLGIVMLIIGSVRRRRSSVEFDL